MSLRLSFSLFLSLVPAFVSAAEWHVDNRNGSDASDGRSVETSFATIQHAVDAAKPGDTILVAPGVYHEHVIFRRGGEADAPILLQAKESGKYETVLTGANPVLRRKEGRWELVEPELGLYRIPLGYRPSRILVEGVDLPAIYLSLEELRALHFPADDYPGHAHGFVWDAQSKMLYVRLRADGKYGPADPNERSIAVSPSAGGGSWGNNPNKNDNFLIAFPFDAPAHAVIEGFTFETPGVAAIYTVGGELVVRDCWFFGCWQGIRGKEDWSTPNVLIERCFYTQYPAFTDIEDTIREHAEKQKGKNKIIHWQRKGGLPAKSRAAGGRAYGYETSFVRQAGKNWTIRENWLWEVFEGFASGSVGGSSNCRIIGNRIERVCDNAVETEDHARDLTFAGNLIIDAFEPISWQPMGGLPLPGPIYIYDNIILQTPTSVALWETSGNTGGIFKIGFTDSNWEKGAPGTPPPAITEASGGFWVAHNTVLVPRGKMFTALNAPGRIYKGFVFVNNAVATTLFGSMQVGGPDEVLFSHNAVAFSEGSPASLSAASGAGGFIANSPAEFKLLLPPSGDFSPAADSPLLQAGLTSRAFPLPDGKRLEIPSEIPLRPAIGSLPFSGRYGPRHTVSQPTQKPRKNP